MQYRNPVIPGFYPDPSICRVGSDYYLATSTFEYFPAIPIFHSRDLVHWRQVGHAVSETAYLDLSKVTCLSGIFAPTIRYHNGWFYVSCTNVLTQGHFIVKTKDPSGEWSAPIWIDIPAEPMTFDPSLFFDDDRTYLTYFTPNGIQQSEIDPDKGELLTKPRLIATSFAGKFPEGPHLYKINGHYYLMVAEGGTEYGHMESIGRADNPWGPFISCPHNPILSHRSQHSPIQVTGHGDIFQDHNGSWWMIFLAVRPHSYQPVHHLGRETYLAPVDWDSDGWPHVAPVKLYMDALLPDWAPLESLPARSCFDSPSLDLRWNFIRNPDPESWSLTERPGFLRLHGLAAGLSDISPVAFVGRRQQHFNVKASVKLEFNPLSEKNEAGLVIRMNEGHHYEIFKTLRNGEQSLVVRRTIGTLSAETACVNHPFPGSVLAVNADHDWYHIGYIKDNTFVELDMAETRYLSTEIARGFTGVYFGMYATGIGTKCSTPADFEWFDYDSDEELANAHA
jgi:xylan 1,4-beta-xylosidase